MQLLTLLLPCITLRVLAWWCNHMLSFVPVIHIGSGLKKLVCCDRYFKYFFVAEAFNKGKTNQVSAESECLKLSAIQPLKRLCRRKVSRIIEQQEGTQTHWRASQKSCMILCLKILIFFKPSVNTLIVFCLLKCRQIQFHRKPSLKYKSHQNKCVTILEFLLPFYLLQKGYRYQPPQGKRSCEV